MNEYYEFMLVSWDGNGVYITCDSKEKLDILDIRNQALSLTSTKTSKFISLMSPASLTAVNLQWDWAIQSTHIVELVDLAELN